MEFSELNLHPDLQKGLNEAGYINCMPVQEQVLQHAFRGQDLYVQSQTGTGKTAAFLVLIFQRLLSEAMLHGKKAIIMVPTRELAVQVEEEAKLLGKYLPFKTGSFYGGVGYGQQAKLLRENAQILVGTPGRVLDLNQGGQMNLMDIAFLVLDEADRMFDMGFYPDLRKLIRVVPPADRRQTMLFSATLNTWVKNLAWEYTKNPFEIAIEPEMVTVEEVEQILYHVSSGDKMKLLLGILKREDPESTLIFCNTKRYAEILAKRLRLNGLESEFIMGDLPQPKRLKIIENIKAGKLRILVATDVAARGLDIEDLSLVINYDLPNESENYVHRIGRTARAGKSGKAITLASEQDVYELPGIERYIGHKIPSETATAEQFSDDKSEGRHIQMDFADEDSRTGRREGRKDGERRPAGREREQKKRRQEKHRNPLRNKGVKAQRMTDDVMFTENSLSELSFEERMVYYRQKYDKSINSDSRNGDFNTDKKRKRSQGKAQGKKPKQREKRSFEAFSTSQTPKEANKSEIFEAKSRKNLQVRQAPSRPQGTDRVSSPPSSQPSSIPSSDQTTVKKGILSRVFGVFRKK